MVEGPTDPDRISDTDAIKFLRFIDVVSGNIVQLKLVDAGDPPNADGTLNYSVATSGGGGGVATLLADALMTTKVIAGGATFEGSVIDLQHVGSVALTIEAAYHAAAIAGIQVDILTSYDNITWDTPQDPWVQTLEPSFLANVTRIRTTTLDSGPRYLKMRVTNLEAIEDVTVTGNWTLRK